MTSVSSNFSVLPLIRDDRLSLRLLSLNRLLREHLGRLKLITFLVIKVLLLTSELPLDLFHDVISFSAASLAPLSTAKPARVPFLRGTALLSIDEDTSAVNLTTISFLDGVVCVSLPLEGHESVAL